MKKWPMANNPADFSELCDEVVHAIRFAYTMKRKNRSKNIPILGPDIAASASSLSGKKLLSSKHLETSEEEQGRDALTEIVGFAIRIGIEQGRRITLNSPEFKMMQLELSIAQQAKKPCSKNEDYPPLQPGTQVSTTQPNIALPNDWTKEAKASQKWGAKGEVIGHHDSHGLCYYIRHDDGTVGHYDPSELKVQ